MSVPEVSPPPRLPKALLFLGVGLLVGIVVEQFIPAAAQRDLLLQWLGMLWLVALAFGLLGFGWAIWLNAALCVAALAACGATLWFAHLPLRVVASLAVGMALCAFYTWYWLCSPAVKRWVAHIRQRRQRAGLG